MTPVFVTELARISKENSWFLRHFGVANLKKDTENFSETSGNFYMTTWRHVPECISIFPAAMVSDLTASIQVCLIHIYIYIYGESGMA